MSRTVIEVLLDGVKIEATGGKKGKHVVMGRLVWPRAGIAERASAQVVEGEAVVLTGQPWNERILFKETVEGRFALELSVTEAVADDKIAAFIRFMGSSLFKVAGDEASGFAGSPIMGKLVELPLAFLGKKAGKESPARILGSGVADLDADELAGGREIVVLLLTPGKIEKMQRKRRGGEWQVKRVKVKGPGDSNGEIKVRVRVVE